MSARPTPRRVSASLVAAAALVALLPGSAGAAPAVAPYRTDTAVSAAPQGYLVQTLPDLDTAAETTPPGSVIVAPGAPTVRVGRSSIRLGLVVHFKDGGPVTYGVQELIRGRWYDMLSMTKTDPADGCAMGGSNWTVPAPAPGVVRVRGFARQDGAVLVTPSYKVTIKPRR